MSGTTLGSRLKVGVSVGADGLSGCDEGRCAGIDCKDWEIFSVCLIIQIYYGKKSKPLIYWYQMFGFSF